MTLGRRVSVLGLAALLAFGVMTGAVSAVNVDIEVEGEQVEDGDEVDLTDADVDHDDVEANVSVSSDSTLESVRIEHDGRTQYSAVNRDSYLTTTSLDVGIGESTLTVTASDSSGDEDSVEVSLTRDAASQAELRSMLDDRERDVEEIEDDIEALERHEANLTEENDRLEQEVDELEQQVDEQGLPGFAFSAAIVAFGLTAFARRRSR